MNISLQYKVHKILRIAIGMCFIGHGAFGMVTKAIWCNYFAVFGISEHLSYQLMPWLGCFDIAVGIIMLVYPVRAIPAWLVIWGIVTASLRPLSGEPFAELLERAGNFGVPLALLLLTGFPENNSGWFTRIDPELQANATVMNKVKICLRLAVFFLFLGHGWLNILEKESLLNQYASLGFFNAREVALIIGIAEISAAFLVLVKPIRPLLFALLMWKMGSELCYPHYVLLEWLERGGSYAALLALWIMTERHFFSVKATTPGIYIRQQG